jgi:uncharacterized protein
MSMLIPVYSSEEVRAAGETSSPSPPAGTVDLIHNLVESLVNHPDQVRVETSISGTAFRIHVAPEDIGQAVGKRGRLANAIRAIVKANAMRDGRRVFVEIMGERREERNEQ